MRRSSLAIALIVAVSAASSVRAEPPTKRPTDVQRGRELYDRHCFQCHGRNNDGDGPATLALVHPVPALGGKIKTDDAAVLLVLRGQRAMPGFEASFDRADARRVLKHMTKLGTKGGTPPPEPEPEEEEEEEEAADGGDAPPPPG